MASKKHEFGPEQPRPQRSGMHRKGPDPVVSFQESMKRASRTTVKLRDRAEKETLRGDWSIEEANTAKIEAPPGIPLESVPRLVRRREDLASLPLDGRAGFLLAHIDDATSVQTLVDVSAMAQEDVVEILRRLVELGVVVLG